MKWRDANLFAFTHSGSTYFLNILLELGVCIYRGEFDNFWQEMGNGTWQLREAERINLGIWFPLFQKQSIFKFSSDLRIKWTHGLPTNPDRKNKAILMIRDGRDVMASFAARVANNRQDEFLNSPLDRRHGSLLDLTPKDEWAFYNIIVRQLVGEERMQVLRFEDIKRNPTTEARRTLKFFDISASDEQIAKAMKASESETVKAASDAWHKRYPQLSNSSWRAMGRGQIGAWRDNSGITVEASANPLFRCVLQKYGYLSESAPGHISSIGEAVKSAGTSLMQEALLIGKSQTQENEIELVSLGIMLAFYNLSQRSALLEHEKRSIAEELIQVLSNAITYAMPAYLCAGIELNAIGNSSAGSKLIEIAANSQNVSSRAIAKIYHTFTEMGERKKAETYLLNNLEKVCEDLEVFVECCVVSIAGDSGVALAALLHKSDHVPKYSSAVRREFIVYCLKQKRLGRLLDVHTSKDIPWLGYRIVVKCIKAPYYYSKRICAQSEHLLFCRNSEKSTVLVDNTEMRPRCPVCHGDKFRRLGTLKRKSRLNLADQQIRLSQRPKMAACHECGTWLTQNPVPEVVARQLYKIKKSGRWSTRSFLLQNRIEAERRLLAHTLKPEQAVLDIGCNNGAALDYVRALGCKTFGVEPCDKDRELCEKKGHLCFSCLDDVPEGFRFDSVLAFDVIEHVYDLKSTLMKIESVLARGGTLFILTGDCESESAIRNGVKWWYADYPEHVTFPSRAGFSMLGWSLENDIAVPAAGHEVSDHMLLVMKKSSQ